MRAVAGVLHIDARVSVPDDSGCEVSPSCLACPLPVCKYDEPGILSRMKREGRDEEIVRLRRRGMAVYVIARNTRVTIRTVYRVLAQAKRVAAG